MSEYLSELIFHRNLLFKSLLQIKANTVLKLSLVVLQDDAFCKQKRFFCLFLFFFPTDNNVLLSISHLMVTPRICKIKEP